MTVIDGLTLTNQVQALYATYPGTFHGIGLILGCVFLYGAVIEISARVAK